MPSEPPRKFVVEYEVQGFEGKRTAGPYESIGEAELQARDIDGYEGVLYVRILTAPERKL
jgi:hypothetical protein